ncbi:MAG: NAD(P)/FAD-dependent oxidoreductase [Gammaproteobacteria bacterium]|nr:NAD(P)/FAD-dependent oxidoreductase [Gammaproteobacteria bacterium]
MGRPRKLLVIGGGITGLCAAVYARQCGYDVELLEQHDAPGGLATSWTRGGYTFETCLHWLLGSSSASPMYRQWRELFDIDRLRFLYPAEFVRIEAADGQSLSIYTNAERMQNALLRRSPQDAEAIRDFAGAVRQFAHTPVPDPGEHGPAAWLGYLRLLPEAAKLRRFSRTSIAEYGGRFRDPLIRAFFDAGESSQMMAITLAFALAWMSAGQAGYPIGGSQAVIRLIAENLRRLGARLRLSARVQSILIEKDAAVGVRLEGGETLRADRVISAADGHATLRRLLGGRYNEPRLEAAYSSWKPYPSYVQVSLGIAQDLSHLPGFGARVLEEPLAVDPRTQLRQLSYRCFHFDPTFAPPGKTALTCFLPTYDCAYWVELREREPERYRAEKARIAGLVADVLEQTHPGLRSGIEVTDVSTPATVVRFTGNWRGSMEGWLPTPQIGLRPLPNHLPGLASFYMAGQWVMPGGGLPGGLMSARAAVRQLCAEDGIRFASTAHRAA